MREAYKLELTGNTELLQTARAALEHEYIKGVNSDKVEELSKACQSGLQAWMTQIGELEDNVEECELCHLGSSRVVVVVVAIVVVLAVVVVALVIAVLKF